MHIQNKNFSTPDIEALFHTLFPICRSITGPGIRRSLEIFQSVVPFRIESVKSGTKVLDWTVPDEWELRSARLTDPNGKLIVNSEDSNLHVLNFSEPFHGDVELDELQKHLYSDEALPDAIPYVTSYYNERWGLCLSQTQRDALIPGTYRVDIDTQKYPGVLNYGVADLPGESDELVLVTSYLCHPSMANNELSGPLALTQIYDRLANEKKRHYSYRFLLIPETIGSIAYLAHHGDELIDRVHAGLVLTCLGGPNPKITFKLSRQDWLGQPSAIDRHLRHLAAAQPEHFAIRPFTPTGGSDERQFCSPGFNLPIAQAARTVYGEYKEYHTSADNLEFMGIETIKSSAEKIFSVLQSLEISEARFRNTSPKGEPQLGRRNLYPSLNGPMTHQFSTDSAHDGRKTLENLLCLLSLATGEKTLRDIAEHIGSSVVELGSIVRHLEEEGLVERVENERE